MHTSERPWPPRPLGRPDQLQGVCLKLRNDLAVVTPASRAAAHAVRYGNIDIVQFVTSAGNALRHDGSMGDKSLKAKQRDQKQKEAAKVGSAAVAKAKQESHAAQRPSSKAGGTA